MKKLQTFSLLYGVSVMHDLTNCEVLTNTFGGSEKKKRLVFDGRIYKVFVGMVDNL